MSREIYQAIILEHFRQARCRESLAEGDADVCVLRNPNCGDIVKLQLVARGGNEGVFDWVHDAQGCAASVSSTSIMCEHLSGLSVDDAKEMITSFLQALDQHSEGEEVDSPWDIELQALLYFRSVPARKLCVSLAWSCAENALAALAQES